MRKLALTLPLIFMAGCVQQVPGLGVRTPLPAPAAPAPVAKPAAPKPQSPLTTARVIDVPDPAKSVPDLPAPAAAKTTAPARGGALDGRTGMHQSAVVAVSGDATRGFTVLFRPDGTDAGKVSSAPGRLCGSKGVASSATNKPKAGSAIPGVSVMIVKCSTAA